MLCFNELTPRLAFSWRTTHVAERPQPPDRSECFCRALRCKRSPLPKPAMPIASSYSSQGCGAALGRCGSSQHGSLRHLGPPEANPRARWRGGREGSQPGDAIRPLFRIPCHTSVPIHICRTLGLSPSRTSWEGAPETSRHRTAGNKCGGRRSDIQQARTDPASLLPCTLSRQLSKHERTCS